MNKNYILSWNTSHLIDVDSDAWLVKFPGYENVSLALLRSYQLPERIEFDAIFDVIGLSDYPVNNVSWPIMSKRMLEVLSEIGAFPYKAIPLVMIDCEVVSIENGIAIRSGKENYEFIGLQLLEHLDAFDWERSVYEPHPRMANRASYIKKLVLKEPKEGFPPLFRLSAHPSALFITDKAREALKSKGIRGVFYTDAEEFQG